MSAAVRSTNVHKKQENRKNVGGEGKARRAGVARVGGRGAPPLPPVKRGIERRLVSDGSPTKPAQPNHRKSQKTSFREARCDFWGCNEMHTLFQNHRRFSRPKMSKMGTFRSGRFRRRPYDSAHPQPEKRPKTPENAGIKGFEGPNRAKSYGRRRKR